MSGRDCLIKSLISFIFINVILKHYFLTIPYSYNAAHSPLQSEPEWEQKCDHIPHLWRRQFCGMVVGLDQAIADVVESARATLGDNTVVVVSPDNGGSTWYGGLNAPLRSGKLTPFEGGVRVPAFAVDFSGRYMNKELFFNYDNLSNQEL